jgi:hypothetical protein
VSDFVSSCNWSFMSEGVRNIVNACMYNIH